MYIILELFDPTFPCILNDEQGIPIIFPTLQEAQKAAQKLHDPRIVEV
ncbi:hypothetical protein [Desulfonatronovibrio magnus]|nr:hypothetical protein [Desulfonatronovibrio magnus]